MRLAGVAGMAAALAATCALAQSSYQPAQHTRAAPLFTGLSPQDAAAYADTGTSVERERPAAFLLAEHRRMAAALAGLQPQRPGVVDAYVVVAGLDSDPVFGREAREAARVLSRRYDAAGRTILLAGSDGARDSEAPMGSPQHLSTALARVAELMDRREDVLVLYTTSHGAPWGIVYADGDAGIGAISPTRLWQELSQLGITNRLVLLSACYAGAFVPMLASSTTAVVTAASAQRTSFGCRADNDWTFFGDALVNRALRKPQPLAAAAGEMQRLVKGWEAEAKLEPSEPQVSIGEGVARWLAPLEARMPKAASAPVGRPATEALDE